MAGEEGCAELAYSSQSASLHPSDEREPARRGIVIQLTGAEGDWGSPHGEELILTQDRADQQSLSFLSSPRTRSVQAEEDRALPSRELHIPPCPSLPGSLEDHSSSCWGFPSPTHRPLVKPVSVEQEPARASMLKPRPLLSLVKSISAELSRSEPDVSQSKSDPKLNLHLWTHLTQPRRSGGGGRDSRTAPPSPVALSPPEPFLRASSLRAELEDTRRKLSEAIHEPLSMFTRIACEEAAGNPRHHTHPASMDSLDSGELVWMNLIATGSSTRTSKTEEHDGLATCDRPSRPCRTDQDAVQDVDLNNPSNPTADMGIHGPSSPVPATGLVCVAVLSYCYFILPLSSYWSGMFVGLAFGFMLGLLLVQFGLLRQPCNAHPFRPNKNQFDWTFQSNMHTLKGWMNETYVYDPESHHPSLLHSVYATLEGPRLQLDYPSNSIPCWATSHEAAPEQSFTHSRTLKLDGSKVFLLPPMLARKRVWNRKYPVCITLAGREDPAEGNETSTPSPSETQERSTFYLFARTGREKEEWFRHLLSASMHQREAQCESSEERATLCADDGGLELTLAMPVSPADLQKIPQEHVSRQSWPCSPTHDAAPLYSCPGSGPGSPTDKEQNACCHGDEIQSNWINALIGRIFWDFLNEKYWADQVSHKIQKKLSKIHLPCFMDELSLTELAMGSCMPQVTGTGLPHVNSRGLWLQLQVEYTGGLQMTLETKINLSKLGKEGGVPETARRADTCHARSRLSVLAESDEESSSAGSSDEDEALPTDPRGTLGDKGSLPGAEGFAGGSTGRRILRFVDKIAKSKYFQKATENEYIKKKIEEMSNTSLLLTVEVQELSGTLAVNIAPPPTDRIWYGFHGPPRLELHVRPKLGEREVTCSHVTEWMEEKLKDEFKKVFVLPNMDDIYMPLMHSAMESQLGPQQPPAQSFSSSQDSRETYDPHHSPQLQ